MIFHINVWKDPRYMKRKRRALQHGHRRKKLCLPYKKYFALAVVNIVRHWLSNLKKTALHGSHITMTYYLYFVLILWLRFSLSITVIKPVESQMELFLELPVNFPRIFYSEIKVQWLFVVLDFLFYQEEMWREK